MDIPFYRSTVALQFPCTDLSGFRLLGEGGGFFVFETDSGLAWRMLKRPAGEAGLDVEIRLWNEQICQHVFPLLNEQQRAWAERVTHDLLNDEAMSDYAPALTHNDLWSEHILCAACSMTTARHGKRVGNTSVS